MSKMLSLLSVFVLILASLACSLPGAVSSPAASLPTLEIPTFTPAAPVEIKPTDLPAAPTFTPEPTALTAQTGSLNPLAIADCDIFTDADLMNNVGAIPETKISASDANQQACQYNFTGGSLYVSIAISLPGREAYENVRQFDALSGGSSEPVALGEIALLKTFEDGRISLEAVLNGWYVVLTEQGLDTKHLLNLGNLLLNELASGAW